MSTIGSRPHSGFAVGTGVPPSTEALCPPPCSRCGWTLLLHLIAHSSPPLDSSPGASLKSHCFIEGRRYTSVNTVTQRTDPTLISGARGISHQVQYLFTQHPRSVPIGRTKQNEAPENDKCETFIG